MSDSNEYKFIAGKDFTGDVSRKQLALALQTVALWFDDTSSVRGRDGVMRHSNKLAYLQKRALNGICYTFARMLQTSEATLLKAKADARKAARQLLNDEITLEIAERANSWVERVEQQMPEIKAALEIAMAAHAFYVGAAYELPTLENEPTATVVRPTPDRQSRKAQLLEEMRRKGLIGDEEAPTNGETTREHELEEDAGHEPEKVVLPPKGVVTVQGEPKLVKKAEAKPANGSAA
jgi:hypothetical protein